MMICMIMKIFRLHCFVVAIALAFVNASVLGQTNANSSAIVGDSSIRPIAADMQVWSVQPNPKIQNSERISTSLSLPTAPLNATSPANQSATSLELLQPYRNRAGNMTAQTAGFLPLDSVPPEYVPWWFKDVSSSVNAPELQLAVSLDVLIHTALVHSPHIQIAAAEPHIRHTNIYEESAQFDWSKFLETKYDDTNDPIGNELTTGNNDDRFRQKEWYGRGGYRRRNRNGGEFEIAQRIGYLDNNSRFLIPPDQASARLELNYRQPLLQGRGQVINESLIVLADIDFQRAGDELIDSIQSHLTEVTVTYWELVRARSRYFQRRRLLVAAEKILAQLEGRIDVDSLNRQVYRARAAVANRRAEIARSWTSIKNAESRLRLLVNEPSLIDATQLEFTPLELPSTVPLPVELSTAIATAIANRPDISQAIRDLRSAHVRLGIADNDLLPRLDLLMGSYIAGLRGSSDAIKALSNQFSESRPGFNLGLEYEFPIGNRAAQSRLQRRQWELNKALQQFRAVVETGLNEVELSVREIATTYQEMNGRYQSMLAAENETSFLLDRWQTLPNIDDSVTLLLEDLLDAQERLADEEQSFSKAQFDYAVAVVELKQAMGTLFNLHSSPASCVLSHPAK